MAGSLALRVHRPQSDALWRVLTGAVNIGHTSQGSINQCYVSTITEENVRIDEALRKFWETENHSVEKPTLSIDEHHVMEHFFRHIVGTSEENLFFHCLWRLSMLITENQGSKPWQECTNWIVVKPFILAGGVFTPECWMLIIGSRASCEGTKVS